jgi:hypothetical protein
MTREIQLLKKLNSFKKRKKFLTWGFSPKGYYDWMQEAKELIPYLAALGIEYYISKGEETDITKFYTEVIQDLFGQVHTK